MGLDFGKKEKLNAKGGKEIKYADVNYSNHVLLYKWDYEMSR